LLPAPTAPSEGYAGVRNLVDSTLRPTYPLSILAHQLRRRIPSCNSLFRGTRSTYSTTWPESSLVVRSARSGRNRDSSQNRPMFRGPSWVNHSCVPLRSPKFRRTPGAASRERQLPLPAPLPGWPRFHFRRSFDNACRRRSDLWSPAASSIRCRLSDEAGTAVPITRLLCTPLPSRGSKIFGNEPVDNGDIGCNRRNFWGFQHAVADSAQGPRPRLPFRSPPTTSLMCLNRL
jgi:hypothetical protein